MLECGIAVCFPFANPELAAVIQSMLSPLPHPSIPMSATADAVENLQSWPMSWIDWPTNNTARLDLYPNRNADRFGQEQVRGRLRLIGGGMGYCLFDHCIFGFRCEEMPEP